MSECISPSSADASKFVTEKVKNNIIKYYNTSLSTDERTDARKKVEEILVKKGACSKINPSLTEKIKGEIYKFDGSNIKEEEKLKVQYHMNMACAIDSLKNMDSIQKYWYDNPVVIGKESVEGIAATISLANSKNQSFVIKTPRSKDNDELVHEALVGMFALNKVRKYVPNFMFVYSYSRCSPMVIMDNNVLNWCDKNVEENTSYLISELISNSQPLSEIIAKNDFSLFNMKKTFAQIINALSIAEIGFNYTHYDLHADNILVSTFKSKVDVPIYHEGDIYNIKYVNSRYIPFIIDYGCSTVTIDNYGSFGKLGLENYGVDAYTKYPMYDVYKLLCFCVENLLRKTSNVLYDKLLINSKISYIQKLFNFFNEGSIIDRVLSRKKNIHDFYNLNGRHKKLSYLDFLKYMLNLPDIEDLISDRNINSITISGDIMNVCDFVNIVTGDKLPESSFEFCQLIMSGNVDKQTLMNIKSNFNIKAEIDKYTTYVKETNNIVYNFDYILIFDDDLVKDGIDQNEYLSSIVELIKIYLRYEHCKKWKDNIMCILAEFEINDDTDYSVDFSDVLLNNIFATIDDNIVTIESNNEYIEKNSSHFTSSFWKSTEKGSLNYYLNALPKSPYE